MKIAKEMKEVSDKNYLARYQKYIENIEDGIGFEAKKGYYHFDYFLSKDSCNDWTHSPLYSYFQGLEKLGYEIAASENERGFDFEISWRK